MSSLWALLLLVGGCTDRGGNEPKQVNTAPYFQTARSPEEAKPISSELALGGSEVVTPTQEPEPQRSNEDLSQLAGEIDIENRFRSAVIVITAVPSSRWKATQCSGVLIAPRVVLTAGHCVCKRRKFQEAGQEDKTLIDGSECPPSATVSTVVYDPSGPDADMSFYYRKYQGQVRPHPELRILLDAQGNVLSSKADLAVIHLSAPPRVDILPVPLADKEVEVHESLIEVHYGSDDFLGWVSDQRHFSRYKITQAAKAGGERFLFHQPQRHLFRGDSGGPFLRENEQGFVLVGISASNLGNQAALTGTYSHRAWVRAEIQRSAQSGSPVPR